MAATEEVRLGQRNFGDEPVRRRIAARDRELAGGLIFNVDVHDDAVRSRSRLVRDANTLEEAQIVQAALRLVHQDLIVRIALAHVELAANDIVACTGVTAHVDALDVDARAFLDDVHDADRAGGRIAVTLRDEPARRRNHGSRPRS